MPEGGGRTGHLLWVMCGDCSGSWNVARTAKHLQPQRAWISKDAKLSVLKKRWEIKSWNHRMVWTGRFQPCSDQGQLQPHQAAQGPIQPDFECSRHGASTSLWEACPSVSPPLYNFFSLYLLWIFQFKTIISCLSVLALLWTAPTSPCFFLDWGLQRWMQYSRWDLSRVERGAESPPSEDSLSLSSDFFCNKKNFLIYTKFAFPLQTWSFSSWTVPRCIKISSLQSALVRSWFKLCVTQSLCQKDCGKLELR